jgi:N-acetylglucosaminyl-diphospho-decaprenol L-rhamnosyltransferase
LLVRHHFGAWNGVVLLLITLWVTIRGTLWRSRRTLYWHTRGRWLALQDYLLGRFGPPPSTLLAPR